MDVNQALQEVLKSALIADGVVHGVDQVCKALDKRQAVLCILAENCDDERYKKLISALCAEHGIPLIKVDNKRNWVNGAVYVKLIPQEKQERLLDVLV